MVTLGISSNTRLVGMSIINEGKLREYSIRAYKSSWSTAKATKIIASLEACVSRYSVNTVVLSIPPKVDQTKEFKLLWKRIKRQLKKKDIPLVEAPPATLLALVPEGELKVKRSLIEALANHFPELRYYYQKVLESNRKYYIKMFEAIAVAAVHERQ
jgi:hypothetical protein